MRKAIGLSSTAAIRFGSSTTDPSGKNWREQREERGRTLNTKSIAGHVFASAAVVTGLLLSLQSPAQADTGNYCYRSLELGKSQCNSYAWYRDIRADIHRAGVQLIWNGTDREMCAGDWDRGTLYSIASFPPGTEGSGDHLRATDAIVDCRYFLQ